ncbi:hypothetical protein HJD18_14130 [Thermoleophilia bacterium SCSIO 60948]|nr:hypothetical protein HJD18_14130 [Thermoleophilia bacterium SCSIO 60948]
MVGLALLAAAPADAARHARVSISPWEKGVMGAVSGGRNVCREGRKVAVFRMRGKKARPGEDKRIARSRTSRGEGPSVWYAQLDARGTLYAKTLRTKRCASAISRTTSKAGVGGGDDNGVPAPTCSPYVSEGPTTFCKLSKVSMICSGDSISRGRGACTTQGANLWVNAGPYPWGTGFGGDVQAGRLDWDHGPHTLSFQTYPWQQFGGTVTSYIRGTIPGPGSADFSVADAWGQLGEGGGSERGDHFYTPNAPGQAAGEFGGPLYLDFRAGDPNPNRNTVTIEGYLFLKP